MPCQKRLICPLTTGQTSCYDDWGNEIDCTNTGQDGDLQAGVTWPSPRFTDNGDGTVTDKLTGLMWLKNGNIYEGRSEWEDAIGFVAWFNSHQNIYTSKDYTANYDDWRLPNVNELESLVNAGVPDTASWLNSQGFVNVQSSYWRYWTSTMYVSAWGSVVWTVKMNDGEKQIMPMSGTENGRHYVWPVRSGQKNNPDTNYPANLWKTGQTAVYTEGDDGSLQMGVAWPYPRFTDNGDGTVVDNLTGLMWLKDVSCMATHYPSIDNDWSPGDGEVTWRHALDFVAGINDGTYSKCGVGYTDWRIPNRKEFLSLIDHSQYDPSLPIGYPFYGYSVSFWTSTTHVSYTDYAYVLNAKDGSMLGYIKGGGAGDSVYGVWPVRNNVPNAGGGANLIPYKPPGWSDAIVVSKVKGTNRDARKITRKNKIFLDFAVINNSDMAITTSFSIDLFVNDTYWNSFRVENNSSNPMPGKSYVPYLDYLLGKLPPGFHQIKLVADSKNEIPETNENDNVSIKNIEVKKR